MASTTMAKNTTETPEEKACKGSSGTIQNLDEEYQGHITGMHTIQENFAKYGMKPTKPSRAKSITLPEGLEDAVKDVLKGKTVTAGTFDKYLRKEHEMYGQNEPLKARKALAAAGIIKQLEGQGDNGTSTFVWLANGRWGMRRTSTTPTLGLPACMGAALRNMNQAENNHSHCNTISKRCELGCIDARRTEEEAAQTSLYVEQLVTHGELVAPTENRAAFTPTFFLFAIALMNFGGQREEKVKELAAIDSQCRLVLENQTKAITPFIAARIRTMKRASKLQNVLSKKLKGNALTLDEAKLLVDALNRSIPSGQRAS